MKDLSAIRALVDEQAEDEGLWFEAQYISEAMLQSALRSLHAVIERTLDTECDCGEGDCHWCSRPGK